MAQAIAEELGRAPMSPALQATLMRAREYASGQSHNQVTVEHLLLALSEDEDAALVLQSSRVDLNRLRHDVADYLGNLGDRSPGPTQPAVSPQLAEILKYATLAAKQGRRAKIDGAIVLAALVGDGRSMAASFLNAQGLTFEEAIRVLQRTAAPSPVAQPVAAPAAAVSRNGANAEDILAAARDRVEKRAPPPRPEPVPVAIPRPESRPVPKSLATSDVESEFRPDNRAASTREVRPHAQAETAESYAGAQPDEPQEPTPPPRDPTPVAMPVPQPATAPLGERPASGAPPRPAQSRDEMQSLPPAVPPHDPSASHAPDVAQPATPADHSGRPPSPTWAPPPLPVPLQQTVQSRMPPPALSAVRPPMAPIPGPPEWTSRPDATRQDTPRPDLTRPDATRPDLTRHDMTPAPPWADPAPRPAAMPHQGQQPGQGLPPGGGPHIGALSGPAYGQYAPPGHPQARAAAQGPFPTGPATNGLANTAPPSDAPRAPAIEAAQLSHSIPKRMRVGQKVVVEVRLARAAIAGGNAGPRPVSLRAELTAFRAISVRLRGTKSAFAIEAGSPETQWDQAIGPTGRLAGDVAVWRFIISPLKAARADLHIIASARTVGADGVIADTVLPDQVVPIRIGRDIGRTMRRFAAGSTIAIVSIAAVKLIEEFLGFDLMRMIRALIGF